MKKTLLFTIAFLGAMTFASAQNSEAMTTDALDTEVFTVGATQDLDDPDMFVITAGNGVVSTNNSYFAITSDAIGSAAPYSSSDDVQGTFTFTAKTTAANLNTDITFRIRKRNGNSLSGTVDVAGSQVQTFSDTSTGETTNSFEYIDVVLTGVELTPTAQTITVNVNSLLRESLTDQASPPTARFDRITIEKTTTLGVEDANIVNNISLYPNPVTNSFQLSSIKDVQNVQIYGITGSLLKTFGANDNYDVSDLATGIYMVNINTHSGSKTLKIVKQ